jgi:hypothetical protein
VAEFNPEMAPGNGTGKWHREMAPGNGTGKWGFLGMLICYTHFSQNSDEAIIKDGYPFKNARITLDIW